MSDLALQFVLGGSSERDILKIDQYLTDYCVCMLKLNPVHMCVVEIGMYIHVMYLYTSYSR